MALHHQFTHPLVTLFIQCLARFNTPRIFTDDVPATAENHLVQFSRRGLNLPARHIPQGADRRLLLLKKRDPVLALPSPFGVGAAGQFVLDHAVADDDPQILRIDRYILLGQGATVEQRGFTGLGAGDDHLIHDAAGHLRKLMLGLLADQGQPHRIHRLTD